MKKRDKRASDVDAYISKLLSQDPEYKKLNKKGQIDAIKALNAILNHNIRRIK